MKRLITFLTTVLLVISFNTFCFADALTDWQAAQAQVAALTAQVQQFTVLAQADPAQVPTLQALQAQLAQAQQNAANLQPAAAQILQAQQAAALQAQQLQAQQAAALQAQQLQAQQGAALKAQQAAALQKKPVSTSGSGDRIVYIPATGDGNRYHVSGCRTIKHGEVAVSLSEAQAMGRTPCGICMR